MNKGKLKVLVMALKEIVEELESEVYSDTEAYTQTPPESAPDEVWDDDDGSVSYTHLTLTTILLV